MIPTLIFFFFLLFIIDSIICCVFPAIKKTIKYDLQFNKNLATLYPLLMAAKFQDGSHEIKFFDISTSDRGDFPCIIEIALFYLRSSYSTYRAIQLNFF